LLFILIGLFGAKNKIRAGYYIFLYTFNLKCLKTKFRETPKTLVTKAIKEILLSVGLIIHGMVTSLVFSYRGPGAHVFYVNLCRPKGDPLLITPITLVDGVRGGLGSHKKLTKYKRDEKLLLVTDTWAIADLSYSGFKDKCKQTIKSQGVKEQRADGFSISRNLDFVRCTLVAGKPVFGLKIQPHSNNYTKYNEKKIFFGFRSASTFNKFKLEQGSLTTIKSSSFARFGRKLVNLCPGRIYYAQR
jgi:hypothetical protein